MKARLYNALDRDRRDASPSSPSENLKPGDVKLTVGRIHGAVQRWKIEGPGDADDGRLRLFSAVVEHHTKKFWIIEADVDERVTERPESRPEQPDLRHCGRIGRVWYPGQRLRDASRIHFARFLVAEKSIELGVADDVERRAGNVVALLIAGGNETGADVDADVRLPESVSQNGGATAVGGDS